MKTQAYLFSAALVLTMAGAAHSDNARVDDMSDIGKFIETVRGAPACESAALATAMGVQFDLKDGSGPFRKFEAKGQKDVARFELREPGEGAKAPGILIAHMVAGSVTREQLVSHMEGASTIALRPNPRANPPMVEESFSVGDTEVHATYMADAPSDLVSVAWHCK